LNNVLALVHSYINQTTPTTDLDLKTIFESFKKLKHYYKAPLSDKEISTYLNLYHELIENKQNYNNCVQLLKKYQNFSKNIKIPIDEKQFDKQFCSNLTEIKLNQIHTDYIDNYYETQANKTKRIYKMENAGKEDIKNFENGMRLFNHCQLANNKIAKYGTHIEVSHVKLLRGKISREKRMKKKQEKDIKISEMKKNKNLNWKVMTHLNEQ
jgi:hypothetical protein